MIKLKEIMDCYSVQENRYKGTNWKFTLPKNAPMTEVALPSVIVDFVEEQVTKDGEGEESTVSQELTNLIIEQKFDGGISGISCDKAAVATKLTDDLKAHEPIQKRLKRWFARPADKSSNGFSSAKDLCTSVKVAKANLAKDPNNEELQEAVSKAESELLDFTMAKALG
jgi:hypothetical protein